MGYCYPSCFEKTLYKWDIYVPLVKKGLMWSMVDSYSWGKFGAYINQFLFKIIKGTVRPCSNGQSITAVYENNCRSFKYREKCISSLHCVEKFGNFIVESEYVINAELYRIIFLNVDFTRRERLSFLNSIQNFIINTNVKLFTA